MHRLPADARSLAEEIPQLSREAARHLKVLRPEDGEEVELFDGAGGWRRYAYDRRADRLKASGPARRDPAPPPLTLFACVTKGSRWDWTVEKCVELGVTRIVPVISARTVVRIAPGDRAAKRERWMRVAQDAARQCDARWLPQIDEPTDFDAALALAAETTCFAGALTEPPPPPLLEVALAAKPAPDRPPAVFVGPEGDFTPEELEALLRVAKPTSFGPTVLRAETAAIFAVAVLAAVTARREDGIMFTA